MLTSPFDDDEKPQYGPNVHRVFIVYTFNQYRGAIVVVTLMSYRISTRIIMCRYSRQWQTYQNKSQEDAQQTRQGSHSSSSFHENICSREADGKNWKGTHDIWAVPVREYAPFLAATHAEAES